MRHCIEHVILVALLLRLRFLLRFLLCFLLLFRFLSKHFHIIPKSNKSHHIALPRQTAHIFAAIRYDMMIDYMHTNLSSIEFERFVVSPHNITTSFYLDLYPIMFNDSINNNKLNSCAALR